MFTWVIKVFSSAQDGMLIEQQSIQSLDLSELDLEAAKELVKDLKPGKLPRL